MSSSVPRFDETERGCCYEVCYNSLCDAFGFEDAGCLQSIYLSILFVIVVVFCGYCLLFYLLLLSTVQIKAFMINVVTAAQDVAVVKNFMKNTIHVVMRINFQ